MLVYLPEGKQQKGDLCLYIFWLVVSTNPLKNDGVKVSWDDDIPNWMESHKIPWFQTTNQLILLVYKTLSSPLTIYSYV